MGEAVKHNSFISKLFGAIADVFMGIREVIAAVIFGPEIIKTFYPEYNHNYNSISNNTEPMRDDMSDAHSERSISAFELFRGNDYKTPEIAISQSDEIRQQNLIQQDLTNYDPAYTFGMSIPNEAVVSQGCTPLSEMSFEEFKNTLEAEIKQEVRISGLNGYVEIGGKFFAYESDELGDKSNIFPITVKESEQDTLVATFDYSLLVNENGEKETNIAMNEIYADNFKLLISESVKSDKAQKTDSISQDTDEVVDSDAPASIQLNTIIPIVEANCELDVAESTIEIVNEVEKMEVSDFVKLAEKGDLESFAQNTKNSSSEELGVIKEEIDILSYTASVGLVRNNFEKAIEIISWQESHLGELYEPTELIEPDLAEETSEDEYEYAEADYEYDDWR